MNIMQPLVEEGIAKALCWQWRQARTHYTWQPTKHSKTRVLFVSNQVGTTHDYYDCTPLWLHKLPPVDSTKAHCSWFRYNCLLLQSTKLGGIRKCLICSKTKHYGKQQPCQDLFVIRSNYTALQLKCIHEGYGPFTGFNKLFSLISMALPAIFTRFNGLPLLAPFFFICTASTLSELPFIKFWNNTRESLLSIFMIT